MYILNIASSIKEMPVKEVRDFIFENYYKRIGFYYYYETFEKKNCCWLQPNL